MGQFGTVNRGVWQSPSARMEVAIKTLKSSAEESDRVKFLQEGAIMGQFKHPNVVRLHGIVREKQTVSFTTHTAHTCTYTCAHKQTTHTHTHTHTHVRTQTNNTHMKHDLAYTETCSLQSKLFIPKPKHT